MMALTIPHSMEECLYFTNRDRVMAWVYRKLCPKCKKARMGKPVVKGKVKTRAMEYACPACGYTEDKITHEASVALEARYTCPKCQKEGEFVGEYKRKLFKGVPSYLVGCQHCGEKIPVTKKLKNIKQKGSAERDVDAE